VVLVMNGTEPEIFGTDGTRSNIRGSLSIQDRFIVLFAGNLGLAQGLAHIIEAGTKLSASNPDILFVFLGNGPDKERLGAEAAERSLQNVMFLPRTTLDNAAKHMSAADALLVPLGSHPIYRKFIPSKLFDCMAAGRPVLLSVDGEARTILEAAEAGIYYPAEDANGLVDAVLKLRMNPDTAAEMGRNGRKYAIVYCSRVEQAKIMTRFIEQITSTSEEKVHAGT